MSAKTISTPDIFGGSSGDSDSSSRGVSEVVGTASLIVLALGLVGGVAAGLGGVTDGINNNGLDGDFTFNQDGDDLSVTVNSLSDAVTDNDGFLAIQFEGASSYDPSITTDKIAVLSQSGEGTDTAGELEKFDSAEQAASTGFVEAEPKTGAVYKFSDTGGSDDISEGTTVTITAFDGEGNGQIIGEFTYGST